MAESLRRLQRDFQAFLLGDGAADAAPPVQVGAHEGRARLLAVYHSAYRLRLIDILGDNCQGLRGVMPAGDFRRLALDYLAACPPSSYTVRDFGNRLAAFLAAAPAWRDRPDLAEMARFDWVLGEAFDAADAACAGFADAVALPPEAWGGLRLAFHPSVRRIALEWNCGAARQAVMDGRPPPPLAKGDAPLPFVIWRQDLKSVYRSQGPDEAWMMAAACDGAVFGDLCEGLCDFAHPDEAAGLAAGYLRRWLDDGLIERLLP